MKKTFCLIIHPVLFVIFLISSASNSYGQPSGKTFFVATTGSDSNPGTAAMPFGSPAAALEATRKAGSGNHKIIMKAGDYFIGAPIELDSRDNGLTIEGDSTGKTILYGGIPVTQWKKDGEKFWSADLDGVKEGSWDFRTLVVNGRMPQRAKMPDSGTLSYLNVFDVPWLTTVGGGWARKPTQEELNVMRYDPKDIPETLDIKNAEVRIYHSWDESLVGIAKNDAQKHEITFSTQPVYPPGGFGRKDYVIYNTREGMTKPGQWYLDRTGGRLVYWPLENENMTEAKVIAPKIERIIHIAGTQDKKAKNITVRALTLQSTSIPFRNAGMGATRFDGALSLANTQNCSVENLEICNIGGVGISASQMSDCRITNCHIYNIGGAGVKFSGEDIFFAYNHIHDVGIYFPSAICISAGGSHNHIYRNEIHDAPYSGMIVGRNDILVEENLIYRVMKEIHDGGAIYVSGASNIILRGNVARDIQTVGTGTPAFGYYLDEASSDCIVEKNVAINVLWPTHNHIAINSIIRDNVFINENDMVLSFQSSSNMKFERNTVITNGKISIRSPNAITEWTGNKLFSEGRDKNKLPQAFKIDSAMPFVPAPAPKNKLLEVPKISKSPVIDGVLATDEWPGGFQRLDRLPSRWPYNGAPVMVKFFRDDKNLYISALVTMFDVSHISKGDEWKKNDGIEISLGGFDKGKPVTFVVRAFVNGTIHSVTDAGASLAASERFGKELRYVAKVLERSAESNRKGWTGEWVIPLSSIGLKARADLKIPFNMCAFVNEYDKWHCWEGTLGETWQVDQAGILELK